MEQIAANLGMMKPPHPILPPRPIRLTKKYIVRSELVPKILYVIGTLVLVGAVAIATSEWVQIANDQSLWERGTPALSGNVEGRRSTQDLFFHSYDLDVRYRDTFGKEHRGRASFEIVGKPVDWTRTEIRYDRQRPEDFVVSWAITNLKARWYSLLSVLAGGLLGIFLLVSIGWILKKKAALLQLCAMQSDEVLLLVTDYQKGTKRVLSSVTYVIPVEGAVRSEVCYFDRHKETPIYGDPERRTILALRSNSAPERPLIVMSDLRRFELSTQQRLDIDANLKKLGVEIVNGRCFPLDRKDS